MPVWSAASGLADTGYAYIPTRCYTARHCAVHVALHGCLQYTDLIGSAFVQNTGYNTWAEANNIIILYPQAHPTRLIRRAALIGTRVCLSVCLSVWLCVCDVSVLLV